MRIGAAFPSKYLKASDLPDGQFVKVTMDHVALEDVAGSGDPDDKKPVLYFTGKQKGMVLNKTNSNTISAAYGDETDEWQGKVVTLYSAETTFNSQTVPCIRVKVIKGGGGQVAPARPAPQPVYTAEGVPEDDIPF